MENYKEMISRLFIMKRLLCLIVSAFFAFNASFVEAKAATVFPSPVQNVMDVYDEDDKFAKWTDEDYNHYEDSVRAGLYPPVIARKADSASVDNTKEKELRAVSSLTAASYVPDSIDLDISKEVGKINISSGTSPTGAKTYEVPIDVYPGMKGFNPNLSLVYNSQQGNSIMGVGWAISGISMISRCGQTMYHDGSPQGIAMDNGDAFLLNGIRLIKTGQTSSYVSYESEQGNIQVQGYFSGTIMKYFKVFNPDGTQGVFGYTANSQNQLYYPLVSLKDLKGNVINYSYSFSDNHYNISHISYNGASVVFKYQKSRPDPILHFAGGLKNYEPELLESITCKLGSAVLGTYILQYSTKNDRTLLARIDYYTASGRSYNPLLFYYGKGDIASDYTASTTQLIEWYEASKPSMIKVVKGKFDYDSGADGLIALPNLNPYWKHYRHSTMFRHSQNRFDNMYKGDEKIFLYTGLKDDWAAPMPNLYTENGFVDILCADLEGKQEEYVIKVNNYVENGNDKVVFNVYRSSVMYGLYKAYTRTYTFPTVYTDADGGQSIQPKFYYAGDFNGDGKMEVLAMSIHQPFGDAGKPSRCYLFDFANDKILHQSHILPYNVDFVGTQQSDPQAAANNSDKLFVMDYDGDGKTDICHIDESGVNIYTFDVSGSTCTPRKVATYTGLKKSACAERDVLLGEFNGDGLMDILVSPRMYATDYGSDKFLWTVYNSKGNGQFESSTFIGTKNENVENTGFIIQDVNGDGVTDMIKYHKNGFSTYLAKNNNVGLYTLHYDCPSANSIFIPTNINSHNSFTQMVRLEKGIVTKYSFSRNDSQESMVTGMVNSLGVIEKNNYALINESESGEEELRPYPLYTKGYGAVFPYVNINEPLTVISSAAIYMNGLQIDKNYFSYNNAVIHRQGLGFRGFEQVTTYNKRGQSTVRTYEPYRFCLLKREVSPVSDNSYTYSVSVQPNKIAKVRMTEQVAKDLLKGTSATMSYVYDAYGYPTEENISYSDGIQIRKVNKYANDNVVGNGYNLGFLVDQTSTVTRNGSSYTERLYIPAFLYRLPNVKVYYKDGNAVKEHAYLYDKYGNPTSETIKLYASADRQKTSYEYDSHGRVTKVTSPMGLTNEYTYDNSGRLASFKDHRNGVTTFSYDSFGRKKSVSYPDGTTETTDFAWDSSGPNGLYSITHSATGKPTTSVVYDALDREVRSTDVRFDGKLRSIDRQYDSYGNLEKVSLPFVDGSASYWNTYTYDEYNRVLSFAEASGKTTTYSYDDTGITTVENNVATTRDYDAQGNLISVTDPSGTVTYNLYADGQPTSIIAPGDVTTTFEYDKYRRQTVLSDPSSGTTVYEYDDAGNISKVTNANGEVITHEYDVYNRLVKTTNPEFSTSYNYNNRDELFLIASTNGTGKAYARDDYGRLTLYADLGADGKWLRKEFAYSDGNVSSVKFTSNLGELVTESYVYSNGHLKMVKLNGSQYYTLLNEDNFGNPVKINSGGYINEYYYTTYGLPKSYSMSRRGGQCLGFNYSFDPATSNMTRRMDRIRHKVGNFYELQDRYTSFGYDDQNRLISFGDNTVTYDEKGNIIEKSDVGSFEYGLPEKPYAVSGVAQSGNAVPLCTQTITYTSFQRPSTIEENGVTASFTYNSAYDRVKMSVSKDGQNILTRHYLGGCYELDEKPSSSVEKLYLLGDYYDAPMVLVKDEASDTIYQIGRDILGSVMLVISPNGSKEKLSFDAWGRLRNPVGHKVYAPGEEPELFLGRGYTGHEHLPWFGLINMNARLYDPALGRFLSPDPNVQNPEMPQNFNRYTYAMNNPLYNVDKDGESFVCIFGIIVGVYLGGVASNHGELNPFAWNYSSPTTYLGMAFGGLTGGALASGGFALAGTVATPYVSAGVTVAGAGLGAGVGTGWKYDFHWSTAAGGGGGIRNYSTDPTPAVDEAIENASWNFRSFQYASTVSLALVADDATFVGIADNVLIPAAYGAAAAGFMYDNAQLIMKRDKEIEGIRSRTYKPRQGVTYALVATKDTVYPDVRNGTTYLHKGEVWKYGETIQGRRRYTKQFYETNNLDMKYLFWGSQMEIKVMEKMYLYDYFIQNWTLPPGNKVFR